MFFPISRNFTKYYLHAKFQISWTIQTEITEICPPTAIPIFKKPGLFSVKWCTITEKTDKHKNGAKDKTINEGRSLLKRRNENA